MWAMDFRALRRHREVRLCPAAVPSGSLVGMSDR